MLEKWYRKDLIKLNGDSTMWYSILVLVIVLAVAVKLSFGEGIAEKAFIFFIIGFIIVVILTILVGG